VGDSLGHDAEQEDPLAKYNSKTELLTEFQFRNNGNMTILSLNAQSINNKFQRLRDFTHRIDASVLCIQETWNTNNTTDYSVKGYQKPYLVTRNSMGSSKNGGGIGLWLKEGIDYEIVKVDSIVSILEMQAVKLIDANMIICNVYRPPGDVDMAIEALENNLNQLRKYKCTDIIIVGDLNIDLSSTSTQANTLLSCTLGHEYLQLITEHTRVTERGESLIDHVYVKSNKLFESYVITTDLSDHYATATVITGTKVSNKKTEITKRWFTPETYTQLETLLTAHDWSPMDNLNTNEAAIHLEKTITEYCDLLAPVETRKLKTRRVNQWTTKGIMISLKHSSRLYKKYKKSKKPDMKSQYKNYKKLLDKVIKRAKDSHYDKMITDAGSDSRRLWSIINEVIDRKQSRHAIPSVFRNGDKTITGKKEIANLFNRYFAKIGKKMADSQPDIPGFEEHLNKVNTTFSLRSISQDEVEKIMSKQQPKLSCGIDTINNKLVKTCSKGLAKPMTMIINKSIAEAQVPATYKKARLIPLFKKGATGDCGNYRPVSLLSALSKILEKVICKQMMSYLDENNLLCPDQFGFRPKSQTNHVVQKMMNTITNSAEQNKVTIATYLDLSKAFDCLQYDKLFKKLEALGFDTNATNWFKDYLSNRTQCVDLDGPLSDWEKVNLGVPQGSICGPILFLLYINDVNNSDSEAIFTKFADDTTVLTTGSSIKEATDKMNRSMKNIDLWFSQNKLNLNPSKTRYMIFNPDKKDPDINNSQLVKIGDEYLERVWRKGKEKAFKLVGVWIDEDLKWTTHINTVQKKINSALYGLSKTGRTLSSRNKRLLYMGLIQSHLVFGAPFWGMAKKTRLAPLITAQKKAVRKIYNLKYRESTQNYFKSGGLLKLPELIKYSTITYIHASCKEDSPANIRILWQFKPKNTAHDLRHRGALIKTSKTSKQWILDLPPNAQGRIWNEYPIELTIKTNVVKRHLKIYFQKST
jgi:exonuclease III